MIRWDLRKIFTRATHDEFALAVKTLQDGLAAAGPVRLEVQFYNGLPSATTTDVEWVSAGNERDRQTKIMTTIIDLKDMTRELWDNAAYVEARLKTGGTYASIEAKGLLPRRLTFYLQSRDPAVAMEDCKESVQKRFPGWRRGDGFFSYHYNVSTG